MNTKLLTTVFTTAMTLHALHCAGQSNVVYYGVNSNSLGVAFIDTSLSPSVQSNITADLRLCLRDWGKNAELHLWDDEDTAGYLDIGETRAHYPFEIKFPKDVVETPNGLSLQVPKELSDAYTNAFAFAKAHSNEVKAAYEFVRFVSSTNFHSVTAQQISNYTLYRSASPGDYEETFVTTTNSLRMQTYYPPSVLGFFKSDKGPAASNLWMLIPCTSVNSGGDLCWNPFTAIWHDGRWKFCMWGSFDR